MATNDNKNKDKNDVPDHSYLQVSIAGRPPEKLTIQLFTNQVPQTCRNFVVLCGETSTTTRQSPYPTYRGCEFHRIIDGFMVQSGDFERFDGTGGYSPISAGGKFPDESFAIKHDQEGIVSMANAGKNMNKSQFFITLKSTPHLDGKHVAFGKVVEGMNIVKSMLSVERDAATHRPVALQRVIITDCGVIDNNNIDKNKKQQDSSSLSSSDDNHQQRKRQRKRKEKERRKNHKHKKRKRSYGSSSSSDTDESESSSKERKRKKHRKRKTYYSSEEDNESDTSYEKKKCRKKYKDKKSYPSDDEKEKGERKKDKKKKSSHRKR